MGINRFIFASIMVMLQLGALAQVPSGGFNEFQKKSFSEGLGKPDYNINVGSQVGTSFNHDYWFTNYIMPSVNFDLTKRFSLVLGTGVSYTSYHTNNLKNNPDGLDLAPVNSYSLFAQASGIYKLNAKTSVSGNVLFEQVTFQKQGVAKSQYKMTDLSVGIHYKPSSNVQLNASFGVSSYPNNLSPFFPDNGFKNPAFNPMFSPW